MHEIGLEYSGHEVRKWVDGDRERKGTWREQKMGKWGIWVFAWSEGEGYEW